MPHRIRSRIARTIQRLWHWRSYRGLTVAIMGPDGAGKSTLVEGLQANCPMPTIVLYMGLTGGVLERVRKIPVPMIRFLLLVLVVWARYFRGQFQKLTGKLVIFDRYIYDAAAPHPDRLTKLQQIARHLSGHLCPGPDLVLLLDAPGTLMFARKGEYSAKMLDEWRWHFRALEKRLPQLFVIDASRSAAEVRFDSARRIWQSYVKRSKRAT